MEETVVLLAQAVHVSLAGASSQQQREQALQVIESVRQSPSCAVCGMYLACLQPHSPIHTAEVRLLGIQLVEYAVRHSWQAYDAQQKQAMKAAVLQQLLAAGTLPLGQEQPFILNKIAELAAEIAKREWPQLWPNFIADLVAVCQLGAAQAYMAISTLRTLAEDIIDFNDDLDAGRRADLQKGLQASLPDIMPFLGSALGSGLRDLRAGTATAASNLVTEATVQALSVYASWVPIPSFLVVDGILDALCALLHSSSHRLLAADVLLQLADRKGSKPDRLQLLRLFDCLPTMIDSIPPLDANPSDQPDEAGYTFVKRICQLLAVLGASQLCPLWGLGLVQAPPAHFENFVRALFNFTCHPSPMVVSFTLPCWLQLVKTNECRQHQCIQQVMLALMEQLSMRVMTNSGDPQAGFVGADAPFNNVDFTTLEEFSAFQMLFRNHISNVARSIASFVPREAVHHVAQLLSKLMEVSNEPQNYNADGSLPANSFLLAAWNGLSLMWEAVMSEAYPIVEANVTRGKGPGTTLDVLKQCFAAALKFDSRDPRLLMAELTVLGALMPCLRLVPEGMDYVLNKLFSALEFNAAADREYQERALGAGEVKRTGLTESAQVRRKAGLLLVQLCSHPPPCFLSALDSVLQRTVALLAQPNLAEMTHNQLVAALASALNAVPDPQLHARYLDDMAAPFVRDWVSEEVTAMVSNPAVFVETSALVRPDIDAMALRRRLLLTVTSLQHILHQTQPRAPDGKLLFGEVGSAEESEGGGGGGGGGGRRSNPSSQQSSQQASPARGRGAQAPTAVVSGDQMLRQRAASSSPAVGAYYQKPLTPDNFPSSAVARVALKNALLFCRTLHALWVPESTPLTGDFAILLDLRRSDLYSALSHHLDGSLMSREMTAQELWIDRSQLWLTTLRENVYLVIGEAARQGVLFETAEVLQVAQECCLHGVPAMQKRHMRLLLRHFLDPLFRGCPRVAEVMAIAAPLLSAAYEALVNAVLKLWEQQQQQRQQQEKLAGDEAGPSGMGGGGGGGEKAGNNSGGRAHAQAAHASGTENGSAGGSQQLHINGGRRGSVAKSKSGESGASHDDARSGSPAGREWDVLTPEHREILEDKALQDVSEALLRHFDQLVSIPAVGGGVYSEAVTHAQAPQQLDALANQLMHTDVAALAVVRFLCATLTLPSSSVASKGASILTKLVNNLGPEPVYRTLVARNVLPTALDGLSIHGEHSDNQSQLLMLIMRCIEVARGDAAVLEVLSRVPNATAEAVRAVVEGLEAGVGQSEAGRSAGGGGGGTIAGSSRQRERNAANASPRAGSAGGSGLATTVESAGSTVVQRRQRHQLKQLLQPIIGVNVGQAWKDDVRVRDLPERLFLAQRDAGRGDDTEDDGTTAALFSAVFDS